ncbi:MAG: hypothetical protein HC831_28480 [Chloroflexia bacterium]|nr:hypothetical protein [Chloroflexia bacterium]
MFLINISSSVDLQNLSEKFKIINVKIIGEAEEIDRGNVPAVIVPNNLDNECFSVVKYVFGKFGHIKEDDVHKYKDLNRLIATETIKVLFNLKEQMASKNIDEKIAKIAINNVMAGTCKGYPWPDDDEFIQNILKTLNNKYYDKTLL